MLINNGSWKHRSKERRVCLVAPDSNQKSVSQCHGGYFTDWKRRLEACRWQNEVCIYHTVINLQMQAVAVGAGSSCLLPTASQRWRHPGAISEIVGLSPSLACSVALPLNTFGMGLLKVRTCRQYQWSPSLIFLLYISRTANVEIYIAVFTQNASSLQKLVSFIWSLL